MFGRGKKNDGFEWHKYVRTTIKLRRQDRREKIDHAKHAAVGGLKEAGRASVTAGATGFQALGWFLVWLGRSIGTFFLLASSVVARAARAGAAWTWSTLTTVAAWIGRPLLVILRRQGVAPALALAGFALAVLGTWSAARASSVGPQALGLMIAGGLGVALAIAPFIFGGPERLPVPGVAWSLPAWLRLPSVAFPPRLTRFAVPRFAVIGGFVAILAAAGGWMLYDGRLQTGSLPSLPGFRAPPIEGRASPITGDTLRVDGMVVRLAGIEAPEREQRCARPGNRNWRCGEAAAEALGRLVRGRTVKCDMKGSDDAGRPLATCSTDGQDVAARLVREGSVFAAGGMFAAYAGQERDAKTEKAGLWRGEAERPSEYRAKLWQAASRTAPDGCPIKGQVSGDVKVYVLPWSREYARVQVRTARGERWFCSERDAQAAGWRMTERG